MTLRGLKSRLLRLEREAKKIDVPTPEEYWAAARRDTARRLRGVYERLARIPSLDGSPAPHLGRDLDAILADDTPEQRRKDEGIIEAWGRGVDLKGAADEARARLLGGR